MARRPLTCRRGRPPSCHVQGDRNSHPGRRRLRDHVTELHRPPEDRTAGHSSEPRGRTGDQRGSQGEPQDGREERHDDDYVGVRVRDHDGGQGDGEDADRVAPSPPQGEHHREADRPEDRVNGPLCRADRGVAAARNRLDVDAAEEEARVQDRDDPHDRRVEDLRRDGKAGRRSRQALRRVHRSSRSQAGAKVGDHRREPTSRARRELEARRAAASPRRTRRASPASVSAATDQSHVVRRDPRSHARSTSPPRSSRTSRASLCLAPGVSVAVASGYPHRQGCGGRIDERGDVRWRCPQRGSSAITSHPSERGFCDSYSLSLRRSPVTSYERARAAERTRGSSSRTPPAGTPARPAARTPDRSGHRVCGKVVLTV